MIRASSCEVHRSRLPDHDHLDLPRILELVLDLARDRLGERRHARVVDSVRRHDDPDLAPAWITLLFRRQGRLERSPPAAEPLHVGLERFAPGPRSRAADRVGGLNEHRLRALVRHVVVVGRMQFMTAAFSP